MLGGTASLAVRTTAYAVTVWFALTLNFLLPRVAPGDPLDYVIGPEAEVLSDEERAAVLGEFGLDEGWTSQYVAYVAGLFRGELGTSLRYGRPVIQLLRDRLPWTLLLILPAIVLSAVLSVALGVWVASHRGKAREAGTITAVLAFDSVPAFWLGMVAVAVFSVQLGWLPSFGAVPLVPPEGWLGWAPGVAVHLVLPLGTLVLASVGHLFLLARGSVQNALAEDYVVTAHALGVAPRRVLFSHVLPNALLPLYTSVTLSLGGVFGGAVLIETVFAYPGVGRLLYDAVSARDYPLLQGTFLLVVLGVVTANWLADVTYAWVDPRVRRTQRARGTAH